jgi:hypothetical protein
MTILIIFIVFYKTGLINSFNLYFTKSLKWNIDHCFIIHFFINIFSNQKSDGNHKNIVGSMFLIC